MTQLDPRLNAYREDLAAASLQDRVRAPRYAEGELRQVSAPAAPIRIAPRFDAPLATEALCGEVLTVYEFREGWAWVQLHDDGYVGYTPVDCLSAVIEENAYRVSARLTYLYPAPDIRRPPITKLSFSCTVAPIGVLEGRFVETLRGGFIFSDHLVGIRERAKDYVRVAERFVGVPYLWGGKTSLGIDCSGLVQISLRAAGVPCMRDSDMQMQSAGEPIDPSNLDAVQRGDLLFWKGHVAIVQSQDWMVHASGQHMEVVVEPLRRAIERIKETHGSVMAILRPPVAAQLQAAAQQRVSSSGESPAIAAQKPAAAEPEAPAPAPSKAPAQQPAHPQPQAAALAPKPAAPVTPPPQPAPPSAAQPQKPPAIQQAAVKPAVTPQAGPAPAAAAAQPQRPASPAPAAAKPQAAQQSGPAPAAGAQTAVAQPQKPAVVHPAATKPAVTAPSPGPAASAQSPAAQPQKQPSPAPAAAKPPSAPPSGPRPAAAAQPAAAQPQKPASPGPAAARPAAAPQKPSLASVNARPPGAPPPGAPANAKGQAPIDAKSLAAQIRASMLAAQEARGEEPAESGWNQAPGTKPGEKPDRTG